MSTGRTSTPSSAAADPDRDHDQGRRGVADQLAEDRRHHEQARQQPIRSHVAADVDEGLGDEVGRNRLEQQRDAGEGELGRAVGLRQGVCCPATAVGRLG
jgi:hypothetical protein